MNGENGASSLATVTRHSRSVAKAAGSPSQKRRRERRTYQLESSSTNVLDRAARPWWRRSCRAGRGRSPPSPAGATGPSGRGRRRSPAPACRCGDDVVGVGVQHVEAVGVPQLEHELAHRLADRLQREAVAVPRLLGGEEVPAQRVGAVAVDDLPRLDRVAQRLGHLAAVLVEDEARGRRRSERGAVEQQRRDRQQRVEPAARLVQRLADEVGGEALLEVLEVVVGGLELGERHRPRVKPHVDHLGHAVHVPAAVVAREDHVVDERAVGVVELDAGLALELGQRAHHLGAAVRAAPHRQRRAPVALARQRPVDVALQPVAEAPVLDVLGVPVDGLVGGQQAVLDLAGGDVPGGLGVVEQRRVAAPAVRIGVLVALGAQQPVAPAQVLDQVRDRRP